MRWESTLGLARVVDEGLYLVAGDRILLVHVVLGALGHAGERTLVYTESFKHKVRFPSRRVAIRPPVGSLLLRCNWPHIVWICPATEVEQQEREQSLLVSKRREHDMVEVQEGTNPGW